MGISVQRITRRIDSMVEPNYSEMGLIELLEEMQRLAKKMKEVFDESQR
jgi:hypothetical protein